VGGEPFRGKGMLKSSYASGEERGGPKKEQKKRSFPWSTRPTKEKTALVGENDVVVDGKVRHNRMGRLWKPGGGGGGEHERVKEGNARKGEG